MAIRFWTKLQHPFQQAVLVEDGRVIEHIPERPPKTPARHIAAVGTYNDELVLLGKASFERWTADGKEQIRGVYQPDLHAGHAIEQLGDNLVICSSGLDLFYMIDPEGNPLWYWWGHEHGLGGKNAAYYDADWTTKQLSGKNYQIDPRVAAHFNSIWIQNDTWLWTAALKRRKVLAIRIGQQEYRELADIPQHGAHSPIYLEGHIAYGLAEGIMVAGQHIFREKHWVKYIRETPEGFVFTHEEGVTFTDSDWRVMHEYPLPRPFQLACLEMDA